MFVEAGIIGRHYFRSGPSPEAQNHRARARVRRKRSVDHFSVSEESQQAAPPAAGPFEKK